MERLKMSGGFSLNVPPSGILDDGRPIWWDDICMQCLRMNGGKWLFVHKGDGIAGW
jgi:hypothetical protein